MKFRFLIADMMSGAILGTNDEATARNFSQSFDHFVGDAENGLWLTPDGEEPIREVNDD